MEKIRFTNQKIVMDKHIIYCQDACMFCQRAYRLLEQGEFPFQNVMSNPKQIGMRSSRKLVEILFHKFSLKGSILEALMIFMRLIKLESLMRF